MQNHEKKLPRIVHLGAEHQVTGSAHLVQAKGMNMLVDCGLPQGSDTPLAMADWPVRPSEIDYLFVTHAHIDHTGRIPMLIKHGFAGEILTTHPTKELIIPMIEDAMGFSELKVSEADEIMQKIDALTWGFEFGESFDLKNGIQFTFRRAGHILGSAFLRLQCSDPPWSVIFSGDLGARDKPLLADPDPPDACDLLVLESTYGDTLHGDRSQRIERLGAVLRRALSDRGKVFIPTFALGRAQELLYDLGRLASDPEMRKNRPDLKLDANVPVFLDSPLGLEVTKVYTRLAPFWDRESRASMESGNNPLDFEQLYSTAAASNHEELLEMDGPMVILAGSGMCTGGRIIDHLKMGIEDPRNDIVFVGYQAKGAPGREIMERGNQPGATVALQDQTYALRAGVHVISGYSAHADQKDLLHWVESMREKPGRIKLVHGDFEARKVLAEKLRSRGYAVSE